MIINRHNYEEYFILYMDNELDSNDRRQVEEFIQKNPDLKEELDILLQYKLVPDTNIVFKGKEELMMHDDHSSVNHGDYEEWLVLYMDNELNSTQKIAVEQFMANHPAAKEELALLQRTRLQPEQIIFADKKSLFRKEEKVRAIPLRWWRIAAAAVLILGAGLTTVIVLDKKSADKENIAKAYDHIQKTNAQSRIVAKRIPVIPDTAQQVVVSISKQTKSNSTLKHNNAINNKLRNNSSMQGTKEESVIADNNKPSNNLPRPINTTRPAYDSSDTNLAGINSFIKQTKPQVQEPVKNNPVTIHTVQPSYASSSTNADDALNQPDSKRSKLRGFFRKVTRTFEKNANMNTSDDDRLLVGGLAIKL
jgi:hypothetical protein